LADNRPDPSVKVVGNVFVVLGAVCLRHEDQDVLAPQFLFRVPEQPFGGRVNLRDQAALIDRDDGGYGGLQDAPKLGGLGRRRGGLALVLRHGRAPQRRCPSCALMLPQAHVALRPAILWKKRQNKRPGPIGAACMSDVHILVVDDDPKVRTLLRRCFEGEGFAVSEAKNGAELRAGLASKAVTLITLDLNLGKENGLDLARELRKDHNIPIIMLTGKGDTIDRVVGLELGADDYLAKPFALRELIARVRAFLRPTPPPAPSPTAPHYLS